MSKSSKVQLDLPKQPKVEQPTAQPTAPERVIPIVKANRDFQAKATGSNSNKQVRTRFIRKDTLQSNVVKSLGDIGWHGLDIIKRLPAGYCQTAIRHITAFYYGYDQMNGITLERVFGEGYQRGNGNVIPMVVDECRDPTCIVPDRRLYDLFHTDQYSFQNCIQSIVMALQGRSLYTCGGAMNSVQRSMAMLNDICDPDKAIFSLKQSTASKPQQAAKLGQPTRTTRAAAKEKKRLEDEEKSKAMSAANQQQSKRMTRSSSKMQQLQLQQLQQELEKQKQKQLEERRKCISSSWRDLILRPFYTALLESLELGPGAGIVAGGECSLDGFKKRRNALLSSFNVELNGVEMKQIQKNISQLDDEQKKIALEEAVLNKQMEKAAIKFREMVGAWEVMAGDSRGATAGSVASTIATDMKNFVEPSLLGLRTKHALKGCVRVLAWLLVDSTVTVDSIVNATRQHPELQVPTKSAMEQAKNSSTSSSTKKWTKRASVMTADEATDVAVEWVKLQFSSSLFEEAMSRYPFERSLYSDEMKPLIERAIIAITQLNCFRSSILAAIGTDKLNCDQSQSTGTLNEFLQLWKTFIVGPDSNKSPRAAFVSQLSFEKHRSIIENYS
ncbi:hypothetical protein GQ42DRAFT_181750 [Ramicandelaber brevisporus]|nr:hypothetical protein GQ42DRAFT_181750 [Ramicandelaber brevisporus]